MMSAKKKREKNMADRFASFEVTDEDLEFEKHNGFYG